MCKGNSKGCVVLGPDPTAWSKYAPLHPHPSLIRSYPHFVAAVRAAASGDARRARKALLRVESDAIKNWYIEHAQVSGNARVVTLGRQRPAPYRGPVHERAYPRPAEVRAVLEADGYRCRYCQREVVHPDLLRALQAVVGKSAFPLGPGNAGRHGSVFAHRAVVDHILPRKRGGRTELGNLVTACYPCNFGKANHTLDDLGLRPPRPATRDSWDGLQSLLPALRKYARKGA